MSERITSAMMAGTTLADINTALNGMQRSESELASGKSIQQPSDNPYGAARAIELQSSIDGMSSYASDAQDGISWTQTASSALSNINEVSQRVRELLVQASNGVNNASDRTAIAEEVDQLAATVKQDANTQYAGQYVFSGTLTSTPPYKPGAEDEYQGNAGQITRTIGPGASLAINADISTVLGNGQGSGDGKLLDTLRTISQHLRSGVPAEVAALGSTDLKSLDSNLEALSTLQAGVGASTAQMRIAASRIEDLQVTAAKVLSSTQDADLAKVSVAYSSEQAAYNAALRAGASIVQTSLLDFLH
jgi:flagellar hook-associated protein 3 FlgL